MTLFLIINIGLYLLVELTLWLSLFIFKPRVVEMKDLHISGAKGLALPNLILLKSEVFHSESVLRHELCHIDQMKRYTVGGTCLILAYHYIRLAFKYKKDNGRFPESFWPLYRENPIEKEAYDVMYDPTPLREVVRIPLIKNR